MQSAIDTLHYTNIAPQHDAFNRSHLHRGDDPGDLDLGLWAQLENHILERGIKHDHFGAQILINPQNGRHFLSQIASVFNDLKPRLVVHPTVSSVITGPVFEEDDPDHPNFADIPYPVRYWKVIAALDSSGKLFATAFLLDQSAVIGRLGLDEAAPIGAFKTYQVTIAEIERLTGLLFTSGPANNPSSLSAVDPTGPGGLDSSPTHRRCRLGFDERSFPYGGDGTPKGSLPIVVCSRLQHPPSRYTDSSIAIDGVVRKADTLHNVVGNMYPVNREFRSKTQGSNLKSEGIGSCLTSPLVSKDIPITPLVE